MRDQLTLHNYSDATIRMTVTLLTATDFADVFSVKELRSNELSRPETTTTPDGVEIWSRDRQMGVLITARGPDSEALDLETTAFGLTFHVILEPYGCWSTCIEVVPVLEGERVAPRFKRGESAEHSVPAQRMSDWQRVATRMKTPHFKLAEALRSSCDDVGALRLFYAQNPQYPTIAAGAPWYMRLFGRDSLLTAWMALILDPGLAIGTVRALAALQGSKVDPSTEEEPGRILNEWHSLTGSDALGSGKNAYYGTADATPLFVMLMGELYRWGFRDKIRALLPNVDRALDWITSYGDKDGDGFVEYQRVGNFGLLNQGWKDSSDAIAFANGSLAQPPIAVAEVQAYVYAAYLARADIANAEGDLGIAEIYRGRAEKLKRAFNEQFWLKSDDFVAVALDKDKNQVDSFTSNPGHCLWTGILDHDKAELVADKLLSPQLFSGWGIRTESIQSRKYNPVSYHHGSVWPHDTAITAAGLMKYGFATHAKKVILGLLDVAHHRDGRLPELFCGFSRDELSIPISYPSACSPQAWSAASPLLLVRAMLSFDPDIPAGVVKISPAVPDEIAEITLDGVALGSSRVTITAHGNSGSIAGLPVGIVKGA